MTGSASCTRTRLSSAGRPAAAARAALWQASAAWTRAEASGCRLCKFSCSRSGVKREESDSAAASATAHLRQQVGRAMPVAPLAPASQGMELSKTGVENRCRTTKGAGWAVPLQYPRHSNGPPLPPGAHRAIASHSSSVAACGSWSSCAAWSRADGCALPSSHKLHARSKLLHASCTCRAVMAPVPVAGWGRERVGAAAAVAGGGGPQLARIASVRARSKPARRLARWEAPR